MNNRAYIPVRFFSGVIPDGSSFGFSPLQGTIQIVQQIIFTFTEETLQNAVVDINGTFFIYQQWGGDPVPQTIIANKLYIPITYQDTLTMTPAGAAIGFCVSGISMAEQGDAPW